MTEAIQTVTLDTMQARARAVLVANGFNITEAEADYTAANRGTVAVEVSGTTGYTGSLAVALGERVYFTEAATDEGAGYIVDGLRDAIGDLS